MQRVGKGGGGGQWSKMHRKGGAKKLLLIYQLAHRSLRLVLLLHPEYLTQQPPEIQVTPEIVYKTVQNEQGVLQNPTGWFVF